MKFQCVFCQSIYKASLNDLGTSVACPNCNKNNIIPRKAFDQGRVIGGDFVIESQLGSGGMGTVYQALQISLQRKVALKILARKYSVDTKYRTEFLREARSVSRIIQMNLVQTFAFGEDEGELYLAMEFVSGDTLGSRLKSSDRLMIDESLNIAQQVAEALHAAWTEQDLIHRDIKPDNIMLTPEGQVKLTDMGLARKSVELENVEEVSGTPSFMNPEQFLKEPMDCRADIYSLGVVLYRCVVGELPFQAKSVKEMARQHIQDPVEFLDKTIDIPSEVRRLIKKMMAKDMEKRHTDVNELLEEIYKIRIKLTGNDDAIPNVHTISFKRYDFKNIKLDKSQGRSKSITKELRRQELRPLSEVTNKVTGGGTGGYKISVKTILLCNLGSLLILFLVFSMAVSKQIPEEEQKSEYFKQCEELFAKKSDLTASEFKTAALTLLVDFPQNPVGYDYQAKNLLLAFDYKQEEKKNLKEVEHYKESLRNQSKKEEALKIALFTTKQKLNRNQERLADYSKTVAEHSDENNTESDYSLDDLKLTLNSEDLKALNFLWTSYQQSIIAKLQEKLKRKSFTRVLAVNKLSTSPVSLLYKDWAKAQLQHYKNAEILWKSLKREIKELEGELFYSESISGEVMIDDKGEVYLQTPNFTEKYLTEFSAVELDNLMAYLVKDMGWNPKQEQKESFYLLSLDFAKLAKSSIPKEEINLYLEFYYDQSYQQIYRLLKAKNESSAIDLARKIYSTTSSFDMAASYQKRVRKLFGINILNFNQTK